MRSPEAYFFKLALRAGLAVLAASGTSPLHANDGFRNGDVFAGIAGGKISLFNGSRLRTSLSSPTGGQQTGMCFDVDGNLYTTDFENSSMSKFDKNGRVLARRWGGPFSTNPESCVVDGQGNVYTGEVFGENRIRKFDPNGRLLASYRPKVDGKGVDWIDLAGDQCTMFYTSESGKVMRYDVCRSRQLPDFMTNLRGACFALRVRENGEVMVACENEVYRLSRSGSKIRTYPIANETLFAMNLDPDGTHFWTGGISSGNVYKVHIESGAGTNDVLFNARGTRKRNTSSFLGQLQNLFDGVSMGGLTVYGERTAAIAEAVRKKEEEAEATKLAERRRRESERLAEEERKRLEAERFAEERRKAEERLAEERRKAEEEERRLADEERRRQDAERRRLEEEQRRRREEEERKRREEEERRRQEEERLRREEEERRKREGRVTFGPARAVSLGKLEPGSEGTGRLDLQGTRVEGYGEVRMTTTLPTSGLALEIETEDGWREIGSQPLRLPLDDGGRRDWPLRLRAGRCAPRVGEGETHHVELAAKGSDGTETRLRVPVEAEVVGSTWLHCWWPVLASSSAGIFLLAVIYGFISPSRFAKRVGVVLSPEEDMNEGHFHAIRAQRGSRSGFYRDARVYVTPDYRVTGRASGAFVRLRADRQQVRIQPMAGSTVWRLTADDEWEALPSEETRMQFGTVYRDDMKSVFFELRNA